METATDTTFKTKIEPRLNLKEPSLYRVIYLNDDKTTMEFVMETLVTIFDMTRDRAEELTIKVHSEGAATVAILPYELAEQKGIEVTVLARNNGFPLQVKLEPDQ